MAAAAPAISSSPGLSGGSGLVSPGLSLNTEVHRRLESETLRLLEKRPIPALVAVAGALAITTFIRDPSSVKKVGEWGGLCMDGARMIKAAALATTRFLFRKRLYVRVVEHLAPPPSTQANSVYTALNWYLCQWATKPLSGASAAVKRVRASVEADTRIKPASSAKESAVKYLFSEEVMKADSGVPELQTSPPVSTVQHILWRDVPVTYARGHAVRTVNAGEKVMSKDIHTIQLSCEVEAYLEEFVEGVLQEYAQYLQENAKKIQYHTLQRGTGNGYDGRGAAGSLVWKSEPFNNRRTLASIALPDGCDLVARVQEFATKEDYYTERGLPYKLVILLHGPPGTGKSVTANAICNFLGRSKCNLTLQDLKSDQDLAAVRSLVDVRKVVFVIDDCDAHVNALLQRTEIVPPAEASKTAEPTPADLLMAQATAMQAMAVGLQNATVRGGGGAAGAGLGSAAPAQTSITLAGFLQFLDGHGADGLVVVMTTNMKDKLDTALWRSCRVDYCLKMPSVSPSQIKHLYSLFYKGHDLPESKIPDLAKYPTIVSADIEAVFKEHKFDPAGAAEALATFVPAQGWSGVAAAASSV